MDATYTELLVIRNTFLPYRLNNFRIPFYLSQSSIHHFSGFPRGRSGPSVTQDNLGLTQSCAVRNDRDGLYAIILLAVRVLCPLF
jgi:hypothetical protein